MKKLFLIAALGVAGIMSANGIENTQKINLTSQVEMVGGYCTVNVYRLNRDGSSTLIGSWGGYADSQAACDAKGSSIVAQLSIGISPQNVIF